MLIGQPNQLPDAVCDVRSGGNDCRCHPVYRLLLQNKTDSCVSVQTVGNIYIYTARRIQYPLRRMSEHIAFEYFSKYHYFLLSKRQKNWSNFSLLHLNKTHTRYTQSIALKTVQVFFAYMSIFMGIECPSG